MSVLINVSSLSMSILIDVDYIGPIFFKKHEAVLGLYNT